MKRYFGYIRVSTQKQGVRGVSLVEQRDAIARYAQREGAAISAWFEERETAAKRGRRVFADMLRRLRANEADGVIIHKIDRSARNLKDWADLGELIDSGIQVLVATESFDLASRGGRLSADIQAVVAADYIRNLREETKKGFYGRLKQGLYPLPAPIGYLDAGGGNPKALDPERAPLIKRAFELYADGNHSLRSLRSELAALGLRSRGGRPLSLNGLSVVLNNPFYAGLIRIHTTGETFEGIHEVIVEMDLFETVQRRLRGKTIQRTEYADLLFRKMIMCANCGRKLVGECQKGRFYYRCHTVGCPVTSIREDRAEAEVAAFLKDHQAPEELVADIDRLVGRTDREWTAEWQRMTATVRLKLANDTKRLDRLTDALVDGVIDQATYNRRREQLNRAILQGRQAIDQEETRFNEFRSAYLKKLELWKSLQSSYLLGDVAYRRNLLEEATSNRTYDGKKLALELRNPFREFKKHLSVTTGCPSRDTPSTDMALLREIVPQNPDDAPEEQPPKSKRKPTGHGDQPV